MATLTESQEYELMDPFGQVEYNQVRELGLSHRQAMNQAGYDRATIAELVRA